MRFAENKGAAADHMPGHQQWIERGLQDEVFLLVGSIAPGLGGAVLAHNTSLPQLRQRVAADPFVAHGVVTAEIVEIAPGAVDPRLDFLAPVA
ncbi:hypothetical protein AB0C07_08635 [Actinoplanes missouriensis]|uniref:YciI family protein n=1 Tax=Actinoplanes missouriensis TaxID=1866 RepID=UPI0033F855F3